MGHPFSMNSKLRYLGILAILPLLTVVLTSNYFVEADAEKSAGSDAPGRVGVQSYGSANARVVCGDKLCKDYPGGYDGYVKNTGGGTEIAKETPKPSDASMKTMPTVPETKDMTSEAMEPAAPGSVLKLSRANVPATIPLHKGWYEGKEVYYIITDSSETKHADIITKAQGWKVELAPLLAKAPKDALSTTYMFTNGVQGKGIHGFQSEVFTSTPAQPEKYSALTAHVHVTWNDGRTPTELKSEDEIIQAQKDNKVTLTPVDVVINMPQIKWPEGQMKVRADKTLTDETGYGGAQVLDINTDKMTVTFVAHRGWAGQEGRTIYYIVTDATPSGPAEMMGVTDSPKNAKLIANAAAVDLFQFMNGIKGTGPLGFQAGIGASAPGDANYSPMWRIFVIGWKDPSSSAVLQTRGDIDYYKEQGLIDVNIARPMNADHIVNCPFIDPFQ
jgi:hypothetical protein